MLFHGPPGTGKSLLASLLAKHACFHQLTAPLAAGDLQKGVPGDAERTLTAIANRAKCIPWVLCAVVIDEIE